MKQTKHSHTFSREITPFTARNLLSSDLDEFLHQLHALAQLAAEQNLRGHPELDLVTSLEQKAEVHGVLPTSLSAEREVDQLLLKETGLFSAQVKLMQKFNHIISCFKRPLLHP